MEAKKRVAIIGAGVSGLVSIKCCLEEGGLEPICFERHGKLGGVWYYTPELRPGQGGAVYDSVVTNSSKEMLAFADFPFPKDCPPFFSHRQAFQYLQDYAAHFDLEKHIRYDTEVTSVEADEDGGYWKIQLKPKDGNTDVEKFDFVMVCSGTTPKAFKPSYKGQENFKGVMFHANEYRNASKFQGKKVVVVGNAFTGCEVAAEISRTSSMVYLSMRNWIPFYPRVGQNGLPHDLDLFRRSSLENVEERLENLSQTRVKDTKSLGFQGFKSKAPDPASVDYTISEEMQDRVVQGQIKPVVEINEFQNNDVILKDGTTLENVDAVIFATGYEHVVPVIDKTWICDESDTLNLYKYVFPVRIEQPSRLALIHIVSTFGPQWQLAELHARIAARVFTGKIVLPDKETMQRDIDQKPKYVGKRATHLPFPAIVEEAAEFLGVKPSLSDLLQSDPELATLYLDGPMVPYWYRLQGPGAWSGARDRIVNATQNTFSSLNGCP